MTGIYEILCTANGKRYIGSSVDIPKRWRNHRRDLAAGTHRSRHLQRAWLKYGPDSFEWAVLVEVPAVALIETEQRYLDKLSGGLFNTAPTAGNTLGCRHTPESKRKMAAAKLGTTRSPTARAAVSAGGKRRFRENPVEKAVLLGSFVSKGWAANRARTKCRRGHAFDADNTFHYPDGSRGCRTCRRAACRKHDGFQGDPFVPRQKSA